MIDHVDRALDGERIFADQVSAGTREELNRLVRFGVLVKKWGHWIDVQGNLERKWVYELSLPPNKMSDRLLTIC